jgi:hypothetical protein
MHDRRHNSEILRFLPWILSIGLLCGFSSTAEADCVPNQSEVPACLSGTAVSGDYAGAVIQEDGQPGLRQVVQGDIVAGWTVEEIGAGYVELKRGTRTARLELPRPDAGNVEEVQPTDAAVPTADAAPPPPAPGLMQRPTRHSVLSPAAAGN